MPNQHQIFLPRLVLTALSGLLCVNVASADSLDTWNIHAGRSMAHHSNVRVNNTNGGADTVTVDTVGLKINKPYSLQRFELDLVMSDSSYQKTDRLDFKAVNYAGAWRWAVTPSLRGNLTSSRDEGRADTASDSINTQTSNIRTTERQRFDADLDLSGGWHLLGGVFRTVVSNSDASREERDNTLNSAELGGRYDFTSGSSVGFLNRTGRGTYDNQPEPLPGPQLDNGFRQTENLLTFAWPITGKTRLNGRVGHLARNHDNYSARDYSGAVGALGMNWEISGKSRLGTGLTRNLSSYESTSSSYSTIDRFFFTPIWQTSERTAVRFNYEYIRQNYLGAVYEGPDTGRRDIKRIGQVALDWQPMNFVAVSASLSDDRRTSNQEIGKFKDTVALISVQLSF
jgi:exopolysaccharide biosynthesis operon protein EpsL